MKKILISIVITNEEMSEVIYAINSILSQTYECIDLMITGNQSSKINIEEILQTIESNKKENIQSIFMSMEKSEYSMEWHCYNVVKQARKKRIDYICFLVNGDALYSKESLEDLMSSAQNDDTLIMGNSVIYDLDGNYCNDFNNFLLSKSKTNGYLKDGYYRQFKRNKELDQCILGGVIYLPTIVKNSFAGMKKEKLHYCPEVPFLRIQLRREQKVNYTDACFINRCISLLKKRRFTQVEVEKLISIMQYLLRNQSKIWGMTEGDLKILKTIPQLLELNGIQHIFDKGKKLICLSNIEFNTKIKVVFFCQHYAIWPSLKFMYEMMITDTRFETDLVYVPFYHFNSELEKVENGMEAYQNKGYPVISYKDYNLQKENPDIAIFISPYSYVPTGFDIKEVVKIVRRCIYIPYGLTLESDIPELVRLRYRLPMECLAWRVCCDDDFGVKLSEQYSYTSGDNFIAWGNPRIDFIKKLPLQEDEQYINYVKNCAGDRKIILWNTHHSLNDMGHSFSSWKKYGEAIVDYAASHQEIFILWRPHPYFKKALEKYLGSTRTKEFYLKLKEHDNILIDEYRGYSAGFSVSDIFLSDQSSLVKEYMFTGKPIILTVNDKEDIMNKELEKCVYVPGDVKSLYETLELLLKGQDLKKELRANYLNKFNVYGGKSVSKNIIDYLYINLRKEIEQLQLY